MMRRSLIICLLLCCCAAYAQGSPTMATSVFSKIMEGILTSVGAEVGKSALEKFKKLFNQNKYLAKNNMNPQLKGGEIVRKKRTWSMTGGNLTQSELKEIAEILKSLDQNREQEIKSANGIITTGDITTGDNSLITQAIMNSSITTGGNLSITQPTINQTGSGVVVPGNNNNIKQIHLYQLGVAGANGANMSGASATKGKCPTPYAYITKVYNAGGRTIEYELKPNFDYEKINVIFFGETEVVRRPDTPISLKTTKGAFEIPDRALLRPVQRGFNFIITDTNGCERWGVVDETALQAEGREENKIRIDHPNPGKKEIAFVIDDLIEK